MHLVQGIVKVQVRKSGVKYSEEVLLWILILHSKTDRVQWAGEVHGIRQQNFDYKLNLRNLSELIGDSSPSIGNVGPLPLRKKKAHQAQ